MPKASPKIEDKYGLAPLAPLWQAAKDDFEAAVNATIQKGVAEPYDDSPLAMSGRSWWKLYNELERIRMAVLADYPPGPNDFDAALIKNETDESFDKGHEMRVSWDRLSGYQAAGWSLINGQPLADEDPGVSQ